MHETLVFGLQLQVLAAKVLPSDQDNVLRISQVGRLVRILVMRLKVKLVAGSGGQSQVTEIGTSSKAGALAEASPSSLSESYSLLCNCTDVSRLSILSLFPLFNFAKIAVSRASVPISLSALSHTHFSLNAEPVSANPFMILQVDTSDLDLKL